MKKIKFELVKDTGRQKFYKCNPPIAKGVKESTVNTVEKMQKEIQNFRGMTFKKRYTLEPMLTDKGIDYVCISDASTHTERLIFPAYKFTDTENPSEPDYTFSTLEIAGTYTYMSEGGNSSTVKEPEYYLKQLAKANRYEYGGASNGNV